MRKTATLVLSSLILAVFMSCARTARVESEATAGKSLTRILPRSTITVIVLDLKKLLAIDAVAKAMQEPKFKEGFDSFVRESGIDPRKDVGYVSFAASVLGASPMVMPTGQPAFKDMAIVINLKYDRARLMDYIKQKNPKGQEETYGGLALYSLFDAAEKGPVPFLPLAPPLLAGKGDLSFKFALLDASHIVMGNDAGIKGIIDVRKKGAESLAKSPEMTAVLGRVDTSGVAWCATSYPPELIEKMVESNPMFKGLEGLKGLVMTFDDKNSTLVFDLRTLGGTKEQNTAGAANFNGLKAMIGAVYGAKEPAVGELLKGTAVSSGNDFTRLTVTVSHETLGKLLKLAEPKAWNPKDPKKDAPGLN